MTVFLSELQTISVLILLLTVSLMTYRSTVKQLKRPAPTVEDEQGGAAEGRPVCRRRPKENE